MPTGTLTLNQHHYENYQTKYSEPIKYNVQKGPVSISKTF